MDWEAARAGGADEVVVVVLVVEVEVEEVVVVVVERVVDMGQERSAHKEAVSSFGLGPFHPHS